MKDLASAILGQCMTSTIGLFALGLFLALPSWGLAAQGTLDPTFSGDGKLTDWMARGDDSARGTAVQPDGKLVVAGGSWTGVTTDFAVTRFNADGSLDITFGIGGKVTTDFGSRNDHAFSVAIQQDGKIVAAGYSSGSAFDSDFAIVRYNTDGSLDTAFGTVGKVRTDIILSNDYALSVAIQADGKIVSAGTCHISSDSAFAVARYNPDGSLDATFDSDGKVITNFSVAGDGANSVAIQSDGKIVTAGYSYGSGVSVCTLARYNGDGSLDASFDGDGIVTTDYLFQARGIALQTDGKIVAATNRYNQPSGTLEFALARYNADGSLDNVRALPIGSPYSVATSVAIQPDGKVVAAGSGLNFSMAVVRLNANFSVDTSFGNNGVVITTIGPDSSADSVVIQPDGKIVAAGDTRTGADYDSCVVRLTTNGSLDPAFDADGIVTTDFGFFQGNVFNDTAVQTDGKIVAAGEVRGDFVLARYNADGSPDATFGGTGKVTTHFEYSYGGRARAVAIQPDGKIVAAGVAFDSDLNEYFALSRYNADGSLDTTFDGDGRVNWWLGFSQGSIALQPDGKIVVAGTANIGFAVARYTSMGSLDTSFGSGGIVVTAISSFEAYATSVAVQPDGKIVAAGFSRDNTFSYFTTVRYNSGGTLDTSFDGDGIALTQMLSGDYAQDVAIQQGGKIVVAGCTSTAYDSPCDNFALARYNSNGALDTTFDGDGRVITPVGSTPSTEAYLRSIAIQPDGKILAAGYSGNGPSFDFTLVRYISNGSLDGTFGGGDGKATVDFDISKDSAYGLAVDNAGRAVVVGESNGRFAIARFLLTPHIPFDFDGDGRSDVSVFRPTDNVWYLDRSSDGFAAVQFGLSTDKLAPADYDGDGKTDIAIFRDGAWWMLGSSGWTVRVAQFGSTGDIAVPADYTGDGRDEIAIYRGGQWWIRDLSNDATSVTHFGIATDKPIVGDYDGDGRMDQAVYRSGEWHMNRSILGYYVIRFGSSTDLPIVGDYDGDGKTDQAVYRNGEWHINRSALGYTVVNFGLSSDVPVPADYDGDGKTDAAVFRNGIWYLLRSASGFLAYQFGLNGDRPVPSAYVP